MKEFIEKLIARLEEINHTDYGGLGSYESHVAVRDCLRDVKEIVNELAEEYKDNVIIDGQYCWQTCGATEHCKDCNRLCNGSIDYYENYDVLAEEYNDGWIPCSERLPEEELEKAMRERGKNAVFPVLATINKVHHISGEKYKIVSRAFYGYYNDKNFYNSCCDRLDVIAWKPLDEPYRPKGD